MKKLTSNEKAFLMHHAIDAVAVKLRISRDDVMTHHENGVVKVRSMIAELLITGTLCVMATRGQA